MLTHRPVRPFGATALNNVRHWFAYNQRQESNLINFADDAFEARTLFE